MVIVMLTRLVENDVVLCHRYWPEEGSELYHIYEVNRYRAAQQILCRPIAFLLTGAFGERTYMVRRLLGKEFLPEKLEDRRDQDCHPIPLFDMAGRRGTPHHQSSLGIPQVKQYGSGKLHNPLIDL